MSDLTITNAGVTVTPKSPGYSKSGTKRAIIRITPTLTAAQHADGDVLFTAVEIPNAVQGEGGVSVLKGAFVVDHGTEHSDVDYLFTFTEGNTVIGTPDATANISSADFTANKMTGFCKLDGAAANGVDFDNFRVHQLLPASGGNEQTSDLTYLKAAEGSTSAYMHCHLYAVNSETAPTYTANQLDIILHIEY